jgi:ABC-type transport system substrate-binding protein
VAWEADATGFDPGFSRGIQAYYLKGNIFNPLVTVDADLNVVPELAESWEAQENGKVYVFHLRQELKFHDGTDFNAEAVRWNIRWTTDRESQSVMDAFLDTIETVGGGQRVSGFLRDVSVRFRESQSPAERGGL